MQEKKGEQLPRRNSPGLHDKRKRRRRKGEKKKRRGRKQTCLEKVKLFFFFPINQLSGAWVAKLQESGTACACLLKGALGEAGKCNQSSCSLLQAQSPQANPPPEGQGPRFKPLSAGQQQGDQCSGKLGVPLVFDSQSCMQGCCARCSRPVGQHSSVIQVASFSHSFNVCLGHGFSWISTTPGLPFITKVAVFLIIKDLTTICSLVSLGHGGEENHIITRSPGVGV